MATQEKQNTKQTSNNKAEKFAPKLEDRQVNIPCLNELPDQQKVGEASDQQNTDASKQT